MSPTQSRSLKASARLLARLGAIPTRLPRPDRWLRYAYDAYRFMKASGEPLPLIDMFPLFGEADAGAGAASGHYFHQDLWAARRVRESGAKDHVDVGSRIDGFVAHCSLVARVRYVDIRPLETSHPNIDYVAGSILELPFADGAVSSLSSLHVIEHIGLGRYGDPIDPSGTDKALHELRRVLAPGGTLYIGCPIGRERICFNAHRVLAPDHVPNVLNDLRLVEAAVVNDSGELCPDADLASFANADYACGLYRFQRDA